MQRIPWSRPEPFGAWVRLDDATLLAVDDRLADRLGVPHGRPHGASSAQATRPLELHLAVTTRCPAPCTGCYLDARPDGHEPAFEALAARLAEARAAGVSTVAFGGGEPLTRGDLGLLAVEARRLGLVPVMTTSGLGLTAARADELRAFAQINVSHDGVGGAYEAVRGFDAAAHAERAIALLAAAGIPVGINLVVTRASFPAIEATAARAADLGAGEIQLLRYKPAGRAADDGYAERRLPDGAGHALWQVLSRLVQARRLRVRIDCAMVPLLSEALLSTVPDAPAALAALGVFGCEAARHLGALTAGGDAAACSFFPLSTGEPRVLPLPLHRAAPAGTGTADTGGADLASTWDHRPDLVRLRAYHAAPPEPCRSCPLFSVCRGGCQIVSRHSCHACHVGAGEGGAFSPDPECPRVLRALHPGRD